MRWKLLLITSAIASLLGYSAVFVASQLLVQRGIDFQKPGLAHVGVFSLSLIPAALASAFVYRHTAKRRRFQATIALLLSLLLTGTLVVGML
ncbi:MAG: hypothetical protein ACRD4L_06045 [Pyrinomonadaceae bacterium]